MRYTVVKKGISPSFTDSDPFLAGAVGNSEAEIVVYLSGTRMRGDDTKSLILVELGLESLGFHTGETSGDEGSNILGFARYRNGTDAPSSLIELVTQAKSDTRAVETARTLLKGAGFTVSVCADQAGRIIDRLVRPKYNAALRLLDEGLASHKDIDLTCRLGLGYPDGPIERTLRGGLAYHHDVSKALFETYGTPAFAPARRAIVAAQRRGIKN